MVLGLSRLFLWAKSLHADWRSPKCPVQSCAPFGSECLDLTMSEVQSKLIHSQEATILDNELLTVKQASIELRCSPSFVYKLMANRQLAYECRGRRKLPLRSSVKSYRERSLVSDVNQSDVRRSSMGCDRYKFKHLFRDRKPGSPESV